MTSLVRAPLRTSVRFEPTAWRTPVQAACSRQVKVTGSPLGSALSTAALGSYSGTSTTSVSPTATGSTPQITDCTVSDCVVSPAAVVVGGPVWRNESAHDGEEGVTTVAPSGVKSTVSP